MRTYQPIPLKYIEDLGYLLYAIVNSFVSIFNEIFEKLSCDLRIIPWE
ncbi:MAG TPA: hypothetical protein PLA12_06530 [Candidatus Hydrogenedens sp.]|nr:hypothetical protein [Candidatus Hydrogenedens sp.]